MKKNKLFAAIILLSNWLTLAAQPSIEWDISFGGVATDRGQKIIKGQDGGYVILCMPYSIDGIFDPTYGQSDIYIVKISDSGEILWKKNYGGSYEERGNTILATQDGGYIIIRDTRSNDGLVSGLHNSADANQDAWVIKIDVNGNLLWQKCYGGIGYDYISNIIPAPDGGYLMVGGSDSKNADLPSNDMGFMNIWIMKITNNGEIEWSKVYGGSAEDFGGNLVITDDGNYLVLGGTYSADGDVTAQTYGNEDIWLFQIDTTGNILWQKAYGGSSPDFAHVLLKTLDGGYILGGSTFSQSGNVVGNHGKYDFWLVKVKNNGAIQWRKCFGGSEYDLLHSLAIMPEGGYIFTGIANSGDGDVVGHHDAPGNDAWVVKVSPYGAIEWQKAMGGTASDGFWDVLPLSDGGIMLCGHTGSTDGDVSAGIPNHYGDIWIVKLSAATETGEPARPSPEWRMTPNPCSGNLTIEADAGEPQGVQIWDESGKCVRTFQDANHFPISLDLTDLPTGTYYLEMKWPDGFSEFKPLVRIENR